MHRASHTSHTASRVAVTWICWLISLAVLGLVGSVAITDPDLEVGPGEIDDLSAQISRADYDEPVWSLILSGSKHLAVFTTRACQRSGDGRVVELGNCPWSFGGTSACSSNGQTLAVGGNDLGVRICDIRSGTHVDGPNPDADAVRCVAFAPDGTALAVVNWRSSAVTIWDWPRTPVLHAGRHRVILPC